MFKSGCIFVHLVVVSASIWAVNCLYKDEDSAIADELKPVVTICIKQCNIKAEYLNIDDMSFCFKKCFLIGIGLITEEGKYNRDEVKKQIGRYTEDDKDAKLILEAVDECFKGKSGFQNDEDEINAVYECFTSFDEN